VKLTVSLIVPVFNSGRLLIKCLESIENQLYTNLEVIMIDDGSTDNSKNICERFVKSDNRFKYIFQKHQGVSVARNTGIEFSSASYISFVDSDDTIEPEYIKVMLNDMLLYDADLGVCDINYIDSHSMVKKISKIRFGTNPVRISDDYSVVNKSRTFIWGKIYKKYIFNNLRFPNVNFGEDIAVTTIAMAKANVISHTPKPLYNYLRNINGSLSDNSRNIVDLVFAFKWTHEKLLDMRIYHKMKNAFKILLVGQTRFVYRRFEKYNFPYISATINELIRFTEECNNEIKGFFDMKFYAYENDNILYQALDKAVINEAQIVTNSDDADYIIMYSHKSIKIDNKEIIEIIMTDECSEDEETILFNIAEQIITNLDTKRLIRRMGNA